MTTWSSEHVALLAQATETVADNQVRHRGTLGGSLAHADPAGDLGAPALALDAEMVIAGASGTRTVPAAEFFVDYFTTAIGEGEILTEIRFPKYTGWGSHYEKFNRTAQAWSMCAVAAAIRVDGGTIARGPGRADQHGHHPDPGDRGGAGAGRAGRPPPTPCARPPSTRRRARRSE